MPVALLNNTATLDAYTDTLTVVFPRPRHAFTLQVFNAAVYYRLAATSPTGQPDWEPGEHFMAPALARFTDPIAEGFPTDALFAGIMVRSAATGVPSRVTVA